MAFAFEVFAALRRKRGFTIEQVAQILDVQRSTVSRWERGLTQPYSKQIKFIARLFRKKKSEFILKGKHHG